MPLPGFLFDRMRADIRQQMDGVLALSGQLSRHRLTPDAEACVQSVAEAALNVRRLLEAVEDLRALEGGVRFDPQPTALRELMDGVNERWRRKAAALNVTLLVSYDGDPEASAMADSQRLMQLFDGFISEALSGRSRGAVEASLTVLNTEAGVRLVGRVRGGREAAWDSDPDLRFRAVEARLGLEAALGVLLARRILADLKGDVRLQANAGAPDTAVFELEMASVATAAPTHASAGGPARPIHILVVDDNATNRMVAQSLVEMFNCTSEAAEDGVEAVEAAARGRFDLILTTALDQAYQRADQRYRNWCKALAIPLSVILAMIAAFLGIRVAQQASREVLLFELLVALAILAFSLQFLASGGQRTLIAALAAAFAFASLAL